MSSIERTLEQVIEAHPFPAPYGGVMVLEQMQKEDIVRLAGWRRALGDLPVGYGKTVIATAVSLMLGPSCTVILVPPILIVQWEKWLNSIPGAGRVVAFEGSPAERSRLDIRAARWIVMSYGIFRNDFKRLVLELTGEVMTIVDEAQIIKNSASATFKAVRDFSAGRDLLLMSGTIMSSPADAYSYIKLNTPERYRSLSHFENVHVEERNIFKQPTKWHNMDLMQTNLNARRVYRSKEEVHASLPKARFIPIYYDLSKDHKKLYDRLMTEQILLLDDGGKVDASTAQKLYHYAQQIITNYGYFAQDEEKRAGVFDLIDAVVDEIALGQPGSSKLILWTIYKMTSARVQQYMLDKGIGSVAAYSGADSKASVAAFLDDPDTTNLVAQPGSAGAGLNPQHLCWNCMYIEVPTTTIPFLQSSGRIDRKGQRYNPNIRLAIARGTVQEGLLQNLFDNDNLVKRASGSKKGIQDLIFPR
jgi:superfamily II DNA or RNA helicase